MYDNLGKIGAKPKEGLEWTLLSGFLIEIPSDKGSTLEVVSLATGTKCIGKNSMSSLGNVVNDSHAEVLARRAFLRYVYSEIKRAHNNESSVLFSGYDGKRKCCLRKDVKFHMFTSHVPCGDASIIPIVGTKRKYEAESIEDVHRTGAKCLPGDARQDLKISGHNYHVVSSVRTKPGRGDPTLSVSCSDKIAKWLYVGIQGALLSLLINGPLLISTITIGGGGQYDSGVLHRALIERSRLSDTCSVIPKIYRSKLVFCHSRYSVTSASKPCTSSIIWYKGLSGKRQFEVAVEGKKQGCTKTGPSKNNLSVTKKEFLKVFLEFSNFNGDPGYRQAKDLATEYQAKVKYFKDTLGSWPVKDPKLECFFST
ncbi:hypothetical protein AAG570_009454 [Ranatra chinensis]|uniref:tRNA-specific adenosine deaminase 1 n=1 Tax=Ranatra chinensis TaxID=642074 RepID=A0ABD0Z678_9HEMI